MTIEKWLIGASIIGAIFAAGWAFHRLCMHLEERGYLYYRSRPKGGSGLAGVLNGIDRLTRPSIEHVIRVDDEVKHDRIDVGGE
jgi:hypothetical protein